MSSILITGGSGSLGTALVQRILDQGLSERICIYSRGEHRQAEMARQFSDERLRFFVGDVRDKQRLTRAAYSVDTIIHAAALKRIETGHYNPDEMVKTNVLGAMNVIEAAFVANVSKVVFVSSDKAYQPVSPYGLSKALAECLALSSNGWGTAFSVVRYGNVSGSQGSVIPAWRGPGPWWISDPGATRFWMEMDQAVSLVLGTVQTMKGGEVNIPELPAYRLADLAEAMDIGDVETRGLGEYEKVHECMSEGNCSDTARRMSVPELRTRLKYV